MVYAHLTVVDKGAGATYDIIITGNKVRIIPTVKSCPESLTQLIEVFRQVMGEDPEIEIKTEVME